jgi:hypothetical protein
MKSTHLANYLWFESYLNAICETDDARTAGRILEARYALEERLLSPVAPGSEEETAIKSAQLGLSILTAERIVRANGWIEDPMRGVPG